VILEGFGPPLIIMKFKRFLEMACIFLLFALILAPGFIFVDIFVHEYYHYTQHKESAVELCFDFNTGSQGHLKIIVPSNSTEGLDPEQVMEEESMANIFGKAASFVYFLIAVIVIIWISHVMTRIRK